jgi:hypothetical protein
MNVTLPEGSSLTFEWEYPDSYIYCAAIEFSENVMLDFGYNACLEITWPDQFFRAVSRAIRHHASFQFSAPIEYRERRTDYMTPHGTPPCLVKGTEYEYQKEFRTLWAPLKNVVEPLIVDVRRAVKYCRVIA